MASIWLLKLRKKAVRLIALAMNIKLKSLSSEGECGYFDGLPWLIA
jgi:hypothetical protein